VPGADLFDLSIQMTMLVFEVGYARFESGECVITDTNIYRWKARAASIGSLYCEQSF
jgi:hypothetical protein